MKKGLILFVLILITVNGISQNVHPLNFDSTLIKKLKGFLITRGDLDKKTEISIGVHALIYNKIENVGVFRFRMREIHANSYIFIWEKKKATIIKNYTTGAIISPVGKFLQKHHGVFTTEDEINLLKAILTVLEERIR